MTGLGESLVGTAPDAAMAAVRGFVRIGVGGLWSIGGEAGEPGAELGGTGVADAPEPDPEDDARIIDAGRAGSGVASWPATSAGADASEPDDALCAAAAAGMDCVLAVADLSRGGGVGGGGDGERGMAAEQLAGNAREARCAEPHQSSARNRRCKASFDCSARGPAAMARLQSTRRNGFCSVGRWRRWSIGCS